MPYKIYHFCGTTTAEVCNRYIAKCAHNVDTYVIASWHTGKALHEGGDIRPHKTIDAQ
jgi:hypothetical protein